jgi:hypothetical protein
MQTSTTYNRLRREEKEEPKCACINSLAFMSLLPHQFTTTVAIKQGDELGIKERAVRHHLRTLCTVLLPDFYFPCYTEPVKTVIFVSVHSFSLCSNCLWT